MSIAILPLFFLCGIGICLAFISGRSYKNEGLKKCKPGYKLMIDNCVLDVACPAAQKYGNGPPDFKTCQKPTDPQKRPKSKLETWFTKKAFKDLFPKANIVWGPNSCWPYSYKAFVIAARYFPRFGAEAPSNGYSSRENYRRDLAAFFAHAIQETGENDNSLYKHFRSATEASACFYRGGLYNWFEGGPTSRFLPSDTPGHDPNDGGLCGAAGVYCASSAELDYWFPCSKDMQGGSHVGCYFGRGAIQISYNFNYGQFQQWLHENGVSVDLLAKPNLVMTHMNPPLAIMASLWFYMTPQPPKPAMHDIVMGDWYPGPKNAAAGYKGPIFGPTSLVINNECHGEDPTDPGGAGESRRIKAFKWFCEYFGVSAGPDNLLTCKGMPQKFSSMQQLQSWQPDWSTTWKKAPCQCAPAKYGGMVPYFQKNAYPKEFVGQNEKNKGKCVKSIYDNPKMYNLDKKTSLCLNYPV